MARKDTIDAGMGRPHMHLSKLFNQNEVDSEIIPEHDEVCFNAKLHQSGDNSNQETQNENNGRPISKLQEIFEENDSAILKKEALEVTAKSEEWPPVFNGLDLILALGGVAVFLMDLVTDWWLAYGYYIKQEILPLSLTVLFILVPSFIAGVISIIWYAMEHKWTDFGTNRINLFFRILFTVFQLGRVYRLAEYICYMVRSWSCCTCDQSRRKHLRMKALEQKVDAAILGLVDGFLESALQLVLQLYLSMKLYIEMDFQRVITIVLSWLSTTITLTSYYRDNRKARKEKLNIGYTGSFVYLVWRICELGPRFLLLSMCGVLFMPWLFIPVAVHFVTMVGFYTYQKPELKGICCTNTSGFPFLVLISYISIFGFINLKDGNTKKTMTVYYVIFYIENSIMAFLVLWYSYTKCMILAKWTYAVYMFFVGSVFHLTFQVVFYKYFHPHKNPICRL